MINNNFSNILIKFGLWLGGAIFIFFYGITHSLALTYTNIGDKADITVVLVSTNYGSQPFNVPKNSGYNFNQVLEIDYQINNYNFEANKNYQLETHLAEQTLTNANYYTVQGLNGESCLISYDNTIFTGNYPRFAFQCPHASNNITISISNSSKQYLWTGDGIFNWQTALLKYSDTSLSGNTGSNDDIINNNNQNTQNIINNNNQNTQDIIDNQNQNTQDIQDTINNNFTDCFNNKNINDFTVGTITSSDGLDFSNSYRLRTNFITSLPNNQYKLVLTSDYTIEIIIFEYDSNKKFIRRQPPVWGNIPFTFTTSENTKYLRIVFRTNPEKLMTGNEISSTTLEGKFCENKLDEQNNSINNLNDNITSDNVDDNGISDAFENFNNYLDDNSTITQLITLPITLYTAILNNVNGTCSPFNLGKLYGEDLILPCINISQYLGNSLWTMIDIIISGFAIYAISKKMIKIFNNFSSLREGDVIDD